MGTVPSSIHTPITSSAVSGNSTSLNKVLTDSVATNIAVHVTGGSFVIFCLILAGLIVYSIYRLQHLHFFHTNTRLDNLAKFVEYPGHENLKKEVTSPV